MLCKLIKQFLYVNNLNKKACGEISFILCVTSPKHSKCKCQKWQLASTLAVSTPSALATFRVRVKSCGHKTKLPPSAHSSHYLSNSIPSLNAKYYNLNGQSKWTLKEKSKMYIELKLNLNKFHDARTSSVREFSAFILFCWPPFFGHRHIFYARLVAVYFM